MLIQLLHTQGHKRKQISEHVKRAEVCQNSSVLWRVLQQRNTAVKDC